ncbi:hypothetical protein [Dactylosporangium sp. NPDC051541]|uniref:hypothetical protein n=1 Tax=Dactylosporangium sp. NPDC051541 TaxID=3363977 RepID=UPI00379A4D82
MAERGLLRSVPGAGVVQWLEARGGVVRWVLLAVAVISVGGFLVAQRQSADVTYGDAPPTATIAEGSAGELSDATVPSVEEMRRMVSQASVVRLPGAVAQWDADKVNAAIAGRDVRILVAPPGLDKDEQTRVRDVDNATVRVIGTSVSGGIYAAGGTMLEDWRAQFARNDITGQLVALITEHSAPAGDTPWREPTAAELEPIIAALRDGDQYGVGPSGDAPRDASGDASGEAPRDAFDIGDALRNAFGTDDALVVAVPAQPRDTAAPDYGPALERAFPGRPIVLMVGSWIEYHGPHAAEFADIAAAGFFARFDDRLSTYAYPRANVLRAYLGWVTDVRYSGLFDRPLPYQPFDPLRVSLPVLPWLFAACVIGFLLLSIRAAGPARPGWVRPGPAWLGSAQLGSAARTGWLTAAPARLAALSALAVEVSGLTTAKTDPDLVRAVTRLGAARTALADALPDGHVHRLLDEAETDLDRVGRSVGVPGYRPAEYVSRSLT